MTSAAPVMTRDALLPFAFASLPVRGAVIQLDAEWRALIGRHDYDPGVREVLGHAAAATPLITQSLKSGTSVTLQITGGEPLSMLVMQCTSELDFRGLATVSGDVSSDTFAGLTQGARCAITIDNVHSDRPYQGIVEVSEASLARNLETYFDRSAQLPSHLALVADESLCGGILLQQLPGEAEPLADDWQRLGLLAETLAVRDIRDGVGTGLLGKLFAEDDIRVYDAVSARFRCRCSRERAANVLRLLGPDECELAGADNEQIVVTCEYCGSRERFDPVDLAALFVDGTAQHSDRVH